MCSQCASPLWTLDETVAYLRISEPTLFRHFKNGLLHRVRIGRRTYVLGEEVRQLIEASKQ